MQFATVSRGIAERVFIVAFNDSGASVPPTSVMEWVLNSTTSEQGYNVKACVTVPSLVTGAGNSPAGLAASTIANQAVGRLQVYGPTTVQVSTTILAGRMAVACSIAGDTQGGAIQGVQSSDSGADYSNAVIGTCIESLSATQSIVHLHNML